MNCQADRHRKIRKVQMCEDGPSQLDALGVTAGRWRTHWAVAGSRLALRPAFGVVAWAHFGHTLL